MKCRDCKHEQHQPGQCNRCNCGESEVVVSHTRSSTLERLVLGHRYGGLVKTTPARRKRYRD